MKQSLVLQLKESVSDSSLRFIHELRLKFEVQGDKSGYIAFNRITAQSVIKGIFEIVSGTGYFMNSSGSINLGQSTEVAANGDSYLRLYASTDIEVSIKNFEIIGTKLGDPEGAPFITRSSVDNSPVLVLNTSELIYKDYIINIWTNLTGSISDLSNLKSLQKINLEKSSLTGPIEALAAITTLNYINLGYCPIDVTLSTLASVKNANQNLNTAAISLRTTNFTGGDLYDYFVMSNDIYNENLSFSTASLKNITCTYISGQSVTPTVNLGLLSLYNSGTMQLPDVIAFLQMLKDGITANTITLVSSNRQIYITVVSAAKTNTTVNALVSDLASLGVTININ